MTPCEQLEAMIEAEPDPGKKAEMSREYRAHCLINGDQQPDLSGGGGIKNPPPPHN